ncbi:G2/M phase-specific E3 ubiquitin-protein ligase-like [Saccostrea echinata]|uniref:G2/M phase-specific E3 ubiquitin-protein ligase-like n=1 Tax=Saccostrea echinata TaxID=191078 RepID=UPI002A81DE66|nr:G2/M phase-specific E3 ubiquitin-protein ligase-like [Saccostrea echinata]
MSFVLTKLSSTIKKDQVTRFNIHRPTIWECTLRKLKREDFDPNNELLIKFSDDFGSTEVGIDQGGPKREYLSLILEYIMNSKLFEGPDNSKTLSWLKSANDKDEYFYAGLMIAVCLVHGGPAPHCFAPCLVEALEKGPMHTKVFLKDMPDPELKTQLEKVIAFYRPRFYWEGGKRSKATLANVFP